MKSPVYIRCPRCELNYIQKKDKFCNVCKIEMKAVGTLGIDENLDLELCPICKVNFINPDEDICVACAKEKALEEGLINDVDNTDDWDSLNNDDGLYNEEEETGEMVSITDLDDTSFDDEDDDLGIGLDDDEDLLDEKGDDGFDDDMDDAFDDLDDDDLDDLDDED